MYDNLNQITESFEEKAKNLPCDTFVWILKGKTVDNQPLLTKLDTIVTNMTSTERDKFGKRFTDIIPNNAKNYIQEYNDHFLEACVEILGWGWLKDRYPPYTPCLTLGTPDLLVKDNSDQIIAAMECKKIRTSDVDRDYYANQQGTITQVNDDLITLFSNKLKDTLCKAEKQVNKSNAGHKFIFLDLSFDTQVWAIDEQRGRVVRLILKLAAELYQRGVALVSFEQFRDDKPITGGGLP